eukprot:g15753.t1
MMEELAKIAQVDFRFAGSEDTAEILSLVNTAFSVEKGDSDLAFTTRDRVNKEEVDACLHGVDGKKRWLVLETSHPEEKMAAACLICMGSTLGTGSVEVLAVKPDRQREGLGSHMLRRAEGILLNFRCRFVKMKVSQWREDVLRWATKQGYKETGGGVLGELDGENTEGLTRPTRYFVLTRDLLTDKKVVGTFGDGTARFTAATAAAANAVNPVVNPASNPAPSAVSWRAEDDSAKGREVVDESESERLAGFLSTVLKGLQVVDAEETHQNFEENSEGGENLAAAPITGMAVGSTASAAASSSVSTSNDELEVVEVQSLGTGGEEESVEDLLSSLMRTLNTEKGRADFRLLASGATS